ncbi:MAG: SGNH/GDSL hydrolase family protein [Janthinobacterium lividum]
MAFLLAGSLAGCGGKWQALPVTSNVVTGADSSAAVNSVILFGDSLSDAGTYAAATDGINGKFTINPASIWIELLAASAGQSISPNIVGYGPDRASWLICPRTACTDYAQGGARVTAPNGVGNEDGSQSGALTLPVVTQIANHLSAHGNRFAGNDLVFVFAGSNDILAQLAAFQQTVTSNPLRGTAAARLAAENAMTQAATDLVSYVRSQLIANGAKRVVVLTLPTASQTPLGQQLLNADARALLDDLTDTFNAALRQGIADNSLDILLYDANAWFKLIYQSPANYGIVNTTDAACDIAKISAATNGAVNNGSSLFCTRDTLVAGAQRDDRYAFADVLHPTPLVHQLFADEVTAAVRARGWMPN